MNTITATNEMPAQSEMLESQKEKTLKQTVFECANVILCHYQKKLEGQLYQVMLTTMELPLLTVTLEEYRSNQTQAAKVLSISRGTLRKKLTYLGLNKHSRPEPYNPTNSIGKALAPMHESVLRNVQCYLANMRGQAVSHLYETVLAEMEAPVLMAVMGAVNNHRTRATHLMGISRTRLRKKLETYGIKPKPR